MCASYVRVLYMFSIIIFQKIMNDVNGWNKLMHEILEVPGIIYET